MRVLWLNPIAFAGLILAAIPIAIHLLVRQQSRRVLFPSLRFLQPSSLASVKRRTLQDVWLLVCRVAIVAVAVSALAGPIFVTREREAQYATRISRAIVVEADRAGGSEELPDVVAARQGAFASDVFSRERVGDAIADAMDWLDRQPPARRELVIISTFPRGFLTAADLTRVPEAVGIRLVQSAGDAAPRDVDFPILVRRGGTLGLLMRRVRLEEKETRANEGTFTPIAGEPIRILAAPSDQALADAALDAVLSVGVRWPAVTPPRQLVIAWAGADSAGVDKPEGVSPLRMDVPSPVSTAASRVADAIAAAIDAPTGSLEPTRLTRAELAPLERAPGLPPANAPPADEGDGRWLWGVALGLLALEQYLRRASRAGAAETAHASTEVRVA